MSTPLFKKQPLTKEQKDDIRQAQKDLKRIKLLPRPDQPVHHEETTSKLIYKGTPMIGGLLSDLTESAGPHLERLSQGEAGPAKFIPFVGLLSNIANLARMALLIKDADERGVDFHLNSTKKAKIAYAIIAITLGILTLALPQVAGILIVTAASLALVSSIATLCKTHWHRHKERMEIKEIKKAQSAIEKRMKEIKHHLAVHELNLDNIYFGGHDEKYIGQISNAKEGIHKLSEEYTQLHQKLARKTELEEKFERKKEKFFDKHLGVPLALVGVIAAVIGLSNPAVGLTIATVGIVTGISVSLIVYVIWPKVLKPLFSKIAGLFSAAAPTPTTVKNDLNPTIAPTIVLNSQMRAVSSSCSIKVHEQTLSQKVQKEAQKAKVEIKPAPKPTLDVKETEGDSEKKGNAEGEKLSTHI